MRYLVSFILLSLFIFSCGKNEVDTAASGNEVTAPPAALPGTEGFSQSKVVIDETTLKARVVEKPTNALSTMIGPSPKSKIDPIPPKVLLPQPQTEQEQRVINVLTKNWWVVQTLARINDKPANLQNQGTYFKFSPYGTYEYGYFKNKVGSGAWTFDGKNALLHLDSELMGDDREWSIKIGTDEDLMIWIGTERYTTNDIQIRLYNFLQTPRNRTEMGLDEKNGKVK